MIERVPHPILRFGAPMFGNHHGALWIWGTRGRPVAVLGPPALDLALR